MDREREWRKVMGLWLVVALAIIMLALFSSSTKGQDRVIMVPYISIVSLAPEDSAAGRVECELGGQPIIGIHPRYLGNKWVMYHEAVHVRQALQHEGGCRGYVEHIKADRGFRLSIEMEAYCEVWKEQQKENVPMVPSMDNIISTLAGTFYGSTWTKEEVARQYNCQVTLAPKDGTLTIPP